MPSGIVIRHGCKEDPRLRTPAPLSPGPSEGVLIPDSPTDLGSRNLSSGPLAQLGLAKTDVHAGADTTNGPGVKFPKKSD